MIVIDHSTREVFMDGKPVVQIDKLYKNYDRVKALCGSG